MGKYINPMGELIMKSAFIFPGQASQKVGMGLDLYKQTSLGKEYFTIANDIMNVDLCDIIFNGPEQTLKQTKYTQPSIYVVSVILGKLLLEKGVTPSALAGHSLGEYSAFAVAGAFDFETGLSLVKIRAESMQESGEKNAGTMAAIMGIEDNDIHDLCDQCQESGIVVPANFNAPGQIVISGEVNAIHAAMKKAKEFGARKVVELNVSGAFHSPLMSSARESLAEMVNSIEITESNYPVICNVSGHPVTEASEIKENLIKQLVSPVLWSNSMLKMKELGIDHFIEVGPGRVLQGLMRRINRTVTVSGIETLSQLNAFEYV